MDRAAKAGNALSHVYAEAVSTLLRKTHTQPAAIRACGYHGQTIRHRPESGYTLQIGNPALLSKLVGISVVADFRSRDIAAGGRRSDGVRHRTGQCPARSVGPAPFG